jgi:hypothetical protein
MKKTRIKKGNSEYIAFPFFIWAIVAGILFLIYLIPSNESFVVVSIIRLFLLVSVITCLLTGIALRKQKSWAYHLAIITSLIMILGIFLFAIYYLNNKDIISFFENQILVIFLFIMDFVFIATICFLVCNILKSSIKSLTSK